MTETERDERMLDNLFQTAAADPRMAPSPDFLARVMSDAETMQPAAPDLQATPEEKPGLFVRASQVLGGWRPVAGLVTTAVVGLVIGFGATIWLPQGVSNLVQGDTDYYLTYLDESYIDVAEGE